MVCDPCVYFLEEVSLNKHNGSFVAANSHQLLRHVLIRLHLLTLLLNHSAYYFAVEFGWCEP